MHFASIAIALVFMCDHTCESLAHDKSVSSQIDNITSYDNLHGFFVQVEHNNSHNSIDFLEYTGEVASIGYTWLQVIEDEENHHENTPSSTYMKTCTWKQIRDCQRFKLNHTLKAFIFSASFWACLIFQLPSGIVINKIGGYWIFMLSTLLIGLVNFILPWAANINEWLIVVIRFIYGALSAASATAEYKLIDEWMMKCDKSISLALIISSQTLGKIIILSISGFIIQSFGWSAIFYLSSFVSLIVTLMILFFIRDKPSQVTWMSQEELKQISLDHESKSQVTDDTQVNTCSTIKIPWFLILTNVPFLSLIFFIFTNSWIFTIYTNELPLFLDQVSGIHITTNGMVNAATNVTRIISLVTSGYLSEKLITCKILTRLKSRKLFSILLGFGQCLCLLVIPYVSHDAHLLAVVLLIATFASGMASGCTLPLHYELSSNYSVVLLSLTDTIGNLTGIIVPIFASVIQVLCESLVTLGWNIIFTSSATMIAVSNVIFLFFIQTERQPFDYV